MNTNNPDNAVPHIIDIATMSFARVGNTIGKRVASSSLVIPRIMRTVHIIARDLRLFSDLKRYLIRIDFTAALIANFGRCYAMLDNSY